MTLKLTQNNSYHHILCLDIGYYPFVLIHQKKFYV
jgi:hypothetical protein